MQPPLRQLAAQLAAGDTTAEKLATHAVSAAQSSDGVFIRVDRDIIAQARDADKHRAALPPLAGVPISVKDLFDLRGEPTLAGSRVLRNAKPAAADATVVQHLRNAGMLFVGRTNMSEFAFSGLGINPHYGTPTCTWDRARGRLPGGSSSGAALSIAEGIVAAALGSDTAGSCRVPAAFNGVVGVKPSFGRLSLRGVYPLSPTSDAPGPLGVDVDSCFLLDQIMARQTEQLATLNARAPDELRLLSPEANVMRDLDAEVETAFARALEVLRARGVQIETCAMPMLDAAADMFMTRAVVLYESWRAHQQRIAARGDEYDPFVRRRIQGGENISHAEQQSRYAQKAELKTAFEKFMRAKRAAAVIYPTVRCAPPPLPAHDDIDELAQINLRCLHNTATVNYVDGCAITLPCHQAGDAPVGLMLSAVHGDDEALFAAAAGVEAILRRNN